tara:strand:- start:31 stop:228 length:198 start_codon:yes stop_codon:yes gene_type:complete
MKHICMRCGDEAHFRYTRERTIQFSSVKPSDYCRECFEIDYPEGLEALFKVYDMAREDLKKRSVS